MFSRILSNYYKARVKWTKLRRMFSIPKGEKVLDIGGGDGPFPRADVVCEKFPGDNSERTRPFLFDRPLVLGDLEALPFQDRSFDFVYCSHILEHASDPAKAISEVTRIGRRGFIEVPSEYLELAATSTPAHLWTIRQDPDGTLVFRPKRRPSPNPHVELYMAFHWKNYYSLFNIGLVWEGEIPFRIDRGVDDINGEKAGFQKGAVDSLESLKETLGAAARSSAFSWDPRRWIKKGVRRMFTDPGAHEWMMNHLACPVCKGIVGTDVTPAKAGGQAVNDLDSGPPPDGFAGANFRRNDGLSCTFCRRTYPFLNGVPILLNEHAGSPQAVRA